MARNRSPSKKTIRRIKNISIDYKVKRQIVRVLKFFFLIVFTIFLTVIFYNLMSSYTPSLEAAHLLTLHRTSNKKVDWHDYDKISSEKKRQGYGEHGVACNYSHLPKELVDEMYALNGYNGALSDIISVDRALPDIRHPDCGKRLYRAELPTTSVVIPFHNEHPSTLIRTGKSILNRSPKQLIKEIIYVDDFSSREQLKGEFEDYIKKNMPLTRIVRLPERRGLIYARTAGAREATGEVLIFLDAHTEATVNWLPPLLDPIAEDYKTCVCPFIDVINHDTFEYKPQDEGGRGVFNWDLLYKRLPRLKSDKERPSEPFVSPVMAGGLFAISSRFFWELGGYDEGLDIWGGEQYELSFKIWQCGGRMLDAPCSRVGHVYRKFAPFPNPRKKEFICVNFRRVLEVWMDEYKQYYYMRHPDCEKEDPGDLTKQLEVRKRLKCKPFKWFMENVAFDLIKKYPLIEPYDVANGQIRNLGFPEQCVEHQQTSLEIRKCDPENWTQKFLLSWKGDVQNQYTNRCWDVSDYSSDKANILYYQCHGDGGNQLWNYDEKTKRLTHYSEGRCLDMNPDSKEVFIQNCIENSQTQRWELQNYNSSANNDLHLYIAKLKSENL